MQQLQAKLAEAIRHHAARGYVPSHLEPIFAAGMLASRRMEVGREDVSGLPKTGRRGVRKDGLKTPVTDLVRAGMSSEYKTVDEIAAAVAMTRERAYDCLRYMHRNGKIERKPNTGGGGRFASIPVEYRLPQ